MTAEQKYRLLRTDEIIEAGDQPLNDDCETWGELAGWEIGMKNAPWVLKPIRCPIREST